MLSESLTGIIKEDFGSDPVIHNISAFLPRKTCAAPCDPSEGSAEGYSPTEN